MEDWPSKERSKEFGSEVVYEDQLEIVLPARHALAKKAWSILGTFLAGHRRWPRSR
jgi:hypothetical protein